VTPVVKLKFGVAVLAFALFAVGARLDLAGLRWAGISLLVVAFLLRFGKRQARE
jgi:hypothetical protein